jgi:hypothetical protein
VSLISSHAIKISQIPINQKPLIDFYTKTQTRLNFFLNIKSRRTPTTSALSQTIHPTIRHLADLVGGIEVLEFGIGQCHWVTPFVTCITYRQSIKTVNNQRSID